MLADMLRLRVDLRPYSGEEYEKRRLLLENSSYTYGFYADDPKVYEVYWTHTETLESVVDIPPHLIRRLGGNI